MIGADRPSPFGHPGRSGSRRSTTSSGPCWRSACGPGSRRCGWGDGRASRRLRGPAERRRAAPGRGSVAAGDLALPVQPHPVGLPVGDPARRPAWFRSFRWLGTPVEWPCAWPPFVGAHLATPLSTRRSAKWSSCTRWRRRPCSGARRRATGRCSGVFRTRPAAVRRAGVVRHVPVPRAGDQRRREGVPPGHGHLVVSILAFVTASLVTILTAYGLALLVERPCIRLGGGGRRRSWSGRANRPRSRRGAGGCSVCCGC